MKDLNQIQTGDWLSSQSLAYKYLQIPSLSAGMHAKHHNHDTPLALFHTYDTYHVIRLRYR